MQNPWNIVIEMNFQNKNASMFCMKYVNATSIPQQLLGYTLTQAKTSSKTALLQNLLYRISFARKRYKVCESCWNLITGKLLNKWHVNRIWWVCSQDSAISCDFPFASQNWKISEYFIWHFPSSNKCGAHNSYEDFFCKHQMIVHSC